MNQLLALLVLSVLSISASDSFRAGFKWLDSVGITDSAFVGAVATDKAHNSYIAGSFQGTLSFPGAAAISGKTDFNLFIAKADSDGRLLWLNSCSGAALGEIKAAANDSEGNLVLSGYFGGSLTYDTRTLSSAGNNDLFVLKLNPQGGLIWAATAGGAGNDYGFGLAVDAQDNIALAGYFTGTANFGTISVQSRGSLDGFIAKYTATGTPLWVKTQGGAFFDYAYAVAVDALGNVYVTGQFSSKAQFQDLSLTAVGGTDMFVVKYDPTGQQLWVNQGGGALPDTGTALAIDASGNCYVVGMFSGTAQFGTETLTSLGAADIFLAKFDPSGQVQSTLALGGAGSDSCRTLLIDSRGFIHLGANIAGDFSLDGIAIKGRGGQDAFIIDVDPRGSFIGINVVGGIGKDEVNGLAAGGDGTLVFGGKTADVAFCGGVATGRSAAGGLFLGALAPPAMVNIAPRIFIEKAPSYIQLSLENTRLGFVFESASVLLPSINWSPFVGAASFSGDQFHIAMGLPAAPPFYRVRTAP